MRQGLSLRALAARTGISVRLIAELERGKGGVSWERLARIAAALGLALEFREIEAPLVDLEQFPELRQLAWHLHRRFVDERDALELYEANWRIVERDRLLPHEVALIETLASRYGHGVLNVAS